SQMDSLEVLVPVRLSESVLAAGRSEVSEAAAQELLTVKAIDRASSGVHLQYVPGWFEDDDGIVGALEQVPVLKLRSLERLFHLPALRYVGMDYDAPDDFACLVLDGIGSQAARHKPPRARPHKHLSVPGITFFHRCAQLF